MRRYLGVSAAALLVAACGSGDEGTIQTEDGEVTYDIDNQGEDVSVDMTGPGGEHVTMRSGNEAVEGMPDGFSVYPGSTVVTSTSVNTTDGSGVLVVLTTSDAPEKVIAFYRQQAEAAGVTIDGEMNTNGTRLIGGEGPGGLAFSASASPGGDGANTVQLTVGRGM